MPAAVRAFSPPVVVAVVRALAVYRLLVSPRMRPPLAPLPRVCMTLRYHLILLASALRALRPLWRRSRPCARFICYRSLTSSVLGRACPSACQGSCSFVACRSLWQLSALVLARLRSARALVPAPTAKGHGAVPAKLSMCRSRKILAFGGV
ncbi:hypothetical protein C8R47DRAFT_1149969 [Mycena vitilis]|nr:hypothetical protein C8R47DRAFT_1149969 [Mycena vitilis]